MKKALLLFVTLSVAWPLHAEEKLLGQDMISRAKVYGIETSPLSAIVTMRVPGTSAISIHDIEVTGYYANPLVFDVVASLDNLQRLAADNSVEQVQIDFELAPDLKQGLELIGADKIRSKFDGSGVSIAIIDSGIDPTHPMLGGSAACDDKHGYKNDKVIGGWDSGEKDPLPCDSATHGTSVAGIAAGLIPSEPEGPGGDYVGGVAPGAKIYALKITKANGRPGSLAYLSALKWIIYYWNADPGNPIKVITHSNSWAKVDASCNESSDSYEKKVIAALEKLKLLGIVVLNSAGNSGHTNALQWPGCMNDVYSVGAVRDTTDGVLPSSNVHEMLDFYAPANPVITTYPGGYGKFGTTSAATPYVAGSIAVLQQAAKSITGEYLSPDEVVGLLKKTGKLIADPKSESGVERPRIDLFAAVKAIK